jgi:F-type H+-transporting ATPase subunit delta
LVLVDRRRIIYLDVIGEKFLELVRALEGLKIVNVQTILPLSYEQEETLINKLKNVTGAKKINLIRKLNKDILGGMILQIDYQVIDMSLKGKLRQISDILGVSLET